MNEEEEEAPLEDPRLRRNRLARQRHASRSKKQRAADANRRATHRAARSDAQIVADASQRKTQKAMPSNAQIAADASWRNDAQITADANRRAVKRTMHNDAQNVMNASWWVVQKTACNDAQIALENVGRVNAQTLLHSDRQHEMHNTDPQAHQGQREQLSEERRQEIQNIDHQARNAQRELDRVNQGGNQMIPLACHEFDGSHRGLRHTLGEMTTMYGKCDALHFLEERAASSSCTNPQFTLCCAQGKVTLPLLAPPLEPLRRLLTSKETDAKDFRQHIRSYNSALAFTFVGANLDTSVAQPGNYTYRLRGELYHRMGSLLPQPGEARKFAQLYISDLNTELDGRMGNFGGLNRDTM